MLKLKPFSLLLAFCITVSLSTQAGVEANNISLYLNRLMDLRAQNQDYVINYDKFDSVAETVNTLVTDEVVYTTARLNLRSEPSVESEIITTSSKGKSVRRTGICSNDFSRVEYEMYKEDGSIEVVSAFMHSNYLTEEEPEEIEGRLSARKSTNGEETEAVMSQKELMGTFKLTAYCSCSKCCGTANNPTASGVMPTQGRTVGMYGVPFGTKLEINGEIYVVEDRGTPFGHLDIFYNSHQEASDFGVQYADVYILNR